jgi:hypothetical protein
MTPYITEILDEINNNPSLVLTKYKDNYAVKAIFEYAFDKTKKFVLPQGIPPFKKDTAPLGMSPGNFYQQVKKFYIFLRKDLTNVRREQLFIQLIEGLHPSEADVCIAIKDQSLTSKYNNITADLAVKAGWVSEENVFRQPNVPTAKSKSRTVVVDLSETVSTNEFVGQPPETESVSNHQDVVAEEVIEEKPKRRGRLRKGKE